jgi:hypothetical protein
MEVQITNKIKLGSDELERIEKVIDSFLRKGKQDYPPTLVVLAGSVASGKTTIRREKYPQDYVLIDAGELLDIFTENKSGDDAKKMEQHAMVAGIESVTKSIAEKRNIVIEILGDNKEPINSIVDNMMAMCPLNSYELGGMVQPIWTL